ncbi:hypothetical protein Q31b_10590 [Novipirellula aureliae]|uniref:Uncharacterized protein n=1 Tax=Novipirellula aureliae TaxID=2527966 RepID=A0A5C6E887_9BACT|nr:hypothetical protein [Novipirellula aureliae]TWU45883.1 hypothetical protein Q31b_10590 [Novipirellula aureliae]
MSHSKKPHDGHDHQNAEHVRSVKSKKIHHDWRFWTAIVLMLLAMVGYVLSLDESVRPDGAADLEVPMTAD